MSICSKCGAAFTCAMQDQTAEAPCWCTQLPHLPLDQMPGCDSGVAAACLCPACLRAWITATQEARSP